MLYYDLACYTPAHSANGSAVTTETRLEVISGGVELETKMRLLQLQTDRCEVVVV